MNEALEDLAFLIKEAKENKDELPVFFLGAGVSKSGDIPLAGEIIEDIKSQFCDSPKVRRYLEKEKDVDYYTLMNCLTPSQRNKLLKEYIEKAKINVAHIYLAQMIVEGFVDYVFTVNFDNLMLRALALYNEFPPTYDMAILKDSTTTTIKEKSVVYLHGQHHGLWLLNTEEELAKVKDEIPKILNSIKDRTWVVIGYSGDDPIFDQIVKLGRFDKDLYWITYKDSEPSQKVMEKLINQPNSNAHLIKGFDADSFMIKLSNALNLPQPSIIEKPFTALKSSLENIVDINDEEHFKDVKNRLEISKRWVNTAISQYEDGKEIDKEENKQNQTDILKKKLIDIIVSEKYDKDAIENLEKEVNASKDISLNKHLSVIFNNLGNELSDLAKQKEDEEIYKESLEKYKKASELNPKDYNVFYNWGNALSDLAEQKEDEEIYKESFEKYKKASELNPKDYNVFYNWGTALLDLARLKEDEEIYKESFEKYKKASELNPKDYNVFYNWGTALSYLAKQKEDEEIYKESLEKYKKASELNPKDYSVFNNWGTALLDLARLKEDEEIYKESFKKFEKSISLGAKVYNLACLYGIKKDTSNALKFLEQSLEKNEVKANFVLDDEDWHEYLENEDFKRLIKKYT